MLNLPYDVLSEIALRLPAVKSKTPWQTINSLATTCTFLYQWKTDKVNKFVEAEWRNIKQKIVELGGWHKGLKAIIGNFNTADNRIYREPVLRKIYIHGSSPERVIKKGYSKFVSLILFKRETATLEEIDACLTKCSNSSVKRKNLIVRVLVDFFPTLSSSDRQKALRLMFNFLNNDIALCKLLADGNAFNKAEKLLGDDLQSKALLELGLHSFGLLLRHPNKHTVKLGLSFVPDEKRWDWVLNSVPKCLDTKFGIEAMLDDPACFRQVIDHLDKSFSGCLGDDNRYVVCNTILPAYSKLCKHVEGKMLTEKLISWFLQHSIRKNINNNGLQSNYLKLLHFGRSEKLLLKKILLDVINYLLLANEYQKSTSIFIAMAKNDKKLLVEFGNFFILNAKKQNYYLVQALNNALIHTAEIKDAEGRDVYIFFLKKIAHEYFGASSEFFKKFNNEANNVRNNLL